MGVLNEEGTYIKGALGTLREEHLRSRSLPGWAKHLIAFAAVMGPGIIVMVGDNDAGGVTTYAQAGQAYGLSLLWLFPLLIGVLYIAQEMVVRLGAVTGAGHGKLILKRFGKFWAAFSVFDLFLLNFLTLVTEFIGIDFGFQFFGISKYISVPIAAAILIALVLGRQFYRWERMMFFFIVISMASLALPFFRPVDWASVAKFTFLPGVQGGLTAAAMIFIVGVVGTTVAPWQLFFQQGAVVDKGIGVKFTNHERLDTFMGSVLTNIVGAALLVAGALAFAGTKFHGSQSNALTIARGFANLVSPAMGSIFAVVLLNASIIGAATVTLASSYAIGDYFGINSSLNSSFREAKGFYLTYVASILIACSIVVVPKVPLGLVTLGVQVLAGILLPSAIGFLLLLCNDSELLGPWVNTPLWNVFGTLIVSILLELSLLLTVTAVDPKVNVGLLVTALTVAVVVASLAVGVVHWNKYGSWTLKPEDYIRRITWKVNTSDLDKPARKSLARNLGLGLARIYILISAALMVLSFIQLAH